MEIKNLDGVYKGGLTQNSLEFYISYVLLDFIKVTQFFSSIGNVPYFCFYNIDYTFLLIIIHLNIVFLVLLILQYSV